MATHYGIRTSTEAQPATEPVAARFRPGPIASALLVPAVLLLAVVIVAVIAIVAPGRADAAGTGPYAATDAPGPALQVPPAELAASLVCTPDLDGSKVEPVLLIPGTTLTPDDEFSWSWEPALKRLGRPSCSVELPGHAMGDIQTAAEYVVSAIRTMRERSGRRVQILGHSQGGMLGRWALRFWPDLRPMVDDLIGLAPSNHGTILAPAVCAVGCAPAFWQQRTDARFVAALNSGVETFAGVDYTVAYTALDEVVIPNQDEQNGSSPLRTGDGRIANLQVQDVCPLHVADHLTLGTSDPVAYAIAVDALTHDGPAVRSRIDPAVCAQALQPGVDPAAFPANFSRVLGSVADQVLTYPKIAAEPPLRCYVTGSCPGAAPSVARRSSNVTLSARRASGRKLRLRVRVAGRATGRVVVSIIARGRARGTTRSLPIRAGRTTTRTVTLPRSFGGRRLTVRARYAGDAAHLPRTATVRVATRR